MRTLVTMLATGMGFAAFAYAGLLLAATYYSGPPLPDGPPAGKAPQTAILVCAAAVGAVCTYRGMPTATIALIAILCGIMAAVWAVDAARGWVPDALTLIPLGVLVVAGLLTGRWAVVVAAAVPAVPFAFVAWRSKGMGLGWGDVKLAALGGAVLGIEDAMLAFMCVSLVAIVVAKIRHTEKQPVAFAPYLACAIIGPLCLHSVVI